MKKDIGLGVRPPEKSCKDLHCPFHGRLPVRGRVFRGKVISDKATNTVTVQWDYLTRKPKYERFERRKTKVMAHNPPCISAAVGDIVTIAECRPLSKTKKFVVVEILKKGSPVEKVDIERTYEEVEKIKEKMSEKTMEKKKEEEDEGSTSKGD